VVTAKFLPKFMGTNVTMGNELAVNFAIAKAHFTGMKDLYVKMVGPGGEKIVEQADWASSGSTYFMYTYDGIAAKQMDKEITVTVFNAQGEAVSETKVDSIKSYIQRNLEKQNAEVKTLFVDILNYGAAAQAYFIKNEPYEPVNSWLSEEQKAYGTSEMKEVSNSLVATTNHMGTNLSLESRISMQMAFSGLKSKNLYALIKFTNHDGKAVNARIENADIAVSGSYRVVRVEQIVVADGRQLVTVELYDADTNELVGSATDSMEGYIARKATGDLEWMKTIMMFSDSAYAYKH
jgi:hypothetical protein